jgi:hypothetical protein
VIYVTRKFAHILSTLGLVLVCPDAFAGTVAVGGTISYGPYTQNAQAIHALSEAMLVVLAFLFAVLAFRALRAYPGGKPLAALLALTVLVLAATSGNRLVQYAQAISYAFTNPGGGTVVVDAAGELPVPNISGITQQIISVIPDPGSLEASTTGQPQCVDGLVVHNNSSCYINFSLPIQ